MSEKSMDFKDENGVYCELSKCPRNENFRCELSIILKETEKDYREPKKCHHWLFKHRGEDLCTGSGFGT